jgi:CII-binding regulator of phage lambda lysogenization HflD
MKKSLIQNIIIAVAAIVLYKLIFAPSTIKTDVIKYENQIIALERKIDSLHFKNSTLKIQADSLEIQVTQYDKKIKNLNTKIYAIKKETQKQLDAINSFGTDELQQFFTDRYGYYKDSIN